MKLILQYALQFLKAAGIIASLFLGAMVLLWAIVFGVPLFWALYFAAGVTPEFTEPPKDEVLISFLKAHQPKIDYVARHRALLKGQQRVYLDQFIASEHYSQIPKPLQIAYGELQSNGITIIDFWQGCVDVQYGPATAWEYFAHTKSIERCNHTNSLENGRYIVTNTPTNTYVKLNPNLPDMTIVLRKIKPGWYINHTVQTEWN